MGRITIPSKHSKAYTDQVADFLNEGQTDMGFVTRRSAQYGQGSRCLLVSREAGRLNHIIAALDDMTERRALKVKGQGSFPIKITYSSLLLCMLQILRPHPYGLSYYKNIRRSSESASL